MRKQLHRELLFRYLVNQLLILSAAIQCPTYMDNSRWLNAGT